MASRMLSGCIQLQRVSWMINSSAKKYSTLTPSRKEILKRLPEHIVPLKLGSCQVYLVGVIHDTQKYVADVQRIVSVVKPNVVYLELCKDRRGMLMSQEIPTTKTMVATAMKNWKDQSILVLFACFMEQLKARQLKIIPGWEFRIAYEEAIKYNGRVILGDRSIEITKNRWWRKMPLSEIIELSLFRKGSKESENEDMDALNRCYQELSKRFPTYAEVYIDERDILMAKGILSAAKKSKSIVAVVGRGHLEGIKKHLQQRKQLNDLLVDDFFRVPPPNHNAIILASIVAKILVRVAIVLTAIKLYHYVSSISN